MSQAWTGNQCPAIMPGPPPADGEYRCELGAGHRMDHCFAGTRWGDAVHTRPASMIQPVTFADDDGPVKRVRMTLVNEDDDAW